MDNTQFPHGSEGYLLNMETVYAQMALGKQHRAIFAMLLDISRVISFTFKRFEKKAYASVCQ
jgi:hypothetical protein